MQRFAIASVACALALTFPACNEGDKSTSGERPPTPTAKALADLEEWFRSPTLRLIGETEAYWPTLREAIRRGAIAGPLVQDARIAAICAANGVSTFFSADRDFSRFPNLRIRNPLL